MSNPKLAHARRGAHWTFNAGAFVQAVESLRRTGDPSFLTSEFSTLQDLYRDFSWASQVAAIRTCCEALWVLDCSRQACCPTQVKVRPWQQTACKFHKTAIRSRNFQRHCGNCKTEVCGAGEGLLPSFDHAYGDPIEEDVQILPETKLVIIEGNYLLLGMGLA